jgi:uncharacterized protein (DUF1810 family)
MPGAANDPFDLQRFVDAQAPVWPRVDAELAAGAKTSHWMWFVFPQLAGLGRSAIAQRFAIRSRDEARAYWQHPLLGPRLKAGCEHLLAIEGRSALQILGAPDDLKLRSSMTLFAAVAPEEPVFVQVLRRFFGGERDRLTLERLDA